MKYGGRMENAAPEPVGCMVVLITPDGVPADEEERVILVVAKSTYVIEHAPAEVWMDEHWVVP